jgi:tRNA (guanine-N7-)-methyltransferase
LSPRSGSSSDQIRFYGRRKGKPLKASRQGLLEQLLPELRIAVPSRALDPRTLFPFPVSSVRLEIGFGGGEHLARQALANPGIGYIGAEVFLNGIASLVRYVHEFGLKNVRIFDDDIRFLLPHLPDASLTRVSLLFPDPWPKARHAKRRFVGPENLREMERLIRPSGELRVASDHPVYIDWALRHLTGHPGFIWTAAGPEDWRRRPADSTPTRYEEKAAAQGRTAVFLNFRRRAPGGETAERPRKNP